MKVQSVQAQCPMFLVIITACLFFGAGALSAPAQVVRGAVTGRITDASGTAIPGVEVTATNQQTGVSV